MTYAGVEDTRKRADLIARKERWFCRCGLSKNQPYRDGSRKLTRGEEPGRLYWYDDAGRRDEVAKDFPGIRAV